MLKKTGIVIGSIVGVFYLLFLILPFFLSGVLNSNAGKIEKMVEDSSGFKIRLEKLSFVTTPKLTAGVKVGHVSVMLPNDEEFFSADNSEFKVSLLPLLIGKVEADVVKFDNIKADLKVQKDGKFLIESYLLPKDDSKENVSTPMTGLPFGLKLSNHLPDVRVKNYDIALINLTNSDKYSLSGENLDITGFILNKKIKVSTVGKITLKDRTPFSYNLKVYNKIMPDIDLNDLLFAQNVSGQEPKESVSFDILGICENIYKNQLEGSLNADVKTFGKVDDVHFNGTLDVEDISLLSAGKKLPKSHLKLTFMGKKILADIALYTAENEASTVFGEIKSGSKIDLAFKSNAQINNIFSLLKSIASIFNYHDFDSLTAQGAIDADFKLKSNYKTVESNGYFKIPSAWIKYALYDVLIDKITADVDFASDTVNFKNIGFSVLSHPLKLYGTIKHDSTTDLHLTADKLLLKGLLTAAGQVSILKDNDIKSGTISLDASIKGKLKEIKPVVDVIVDNVYVLNKPSATSVKVRDSKINITSSGKSYLGDIVVNSVNVINPSLTVNVPKVNIKLDEDDINISDSYLLIDNSKIDITGKITDYTTKKMAINLQASGALIANDLRNMIPKELRSFFTAKGSMPLLVKISGNDKKQVVDAQILATPSGYLHVFDINSITGKSALVRSNITLENNNLKLADTGLYSTNRKDLSDTSDKSQIVRVAGKVEDLSNPVFNTLKVDTISPQIISVPGFKNSKANVSGNIVLSGNVMSPLMKGIVSVLNVDLPSIKTSLKNITADLGGDVIDLKLPLITIDNSTMSANAQLSSDFSKGIIIKSVDFKGDLIDSDTLVTSLAGLNTSSSVPATSSKNSNSASQDIGIVIQDGDGTVTKFKSGKIVATNLTSDFGLKNNIFYLKGLKGDAFSGKINGNINCNVVSGATSVDMTGTDMNAENAINASAGIPNALSGILGFTAKLKLNAFASDFNAMLKSINGDVTFDVKDGHYANIGRLDNLLLAQNLAANAILKAALAPIRNMPVVQNTSNFKTINGSLSLKNGIVQLKSVKSTGPSLAYFVTGQYNLISGYTNVVILGRMGADVVSALGVLGDLSATKLTSYLPKFGTQTAKILDALTSNPASENTSQIPALSTSDKNSKDFKVVFTGPVTSASSIKSFKWLTTCDTSAITGGSLKDQLKESTSALKEAGKNNVEDVKKGVENVKEAAKNTVDNVKDQVQRTKDSINEIKNLFKKKEPATSSQ